jgi:hypothetical protein
VRDNLIFAHIELLVAWMCFGEQSYASLASYAALLVVGWIEYLLVNVFPNIAKAV